MRGVQANSFYFRTIKPWNDLPAEVVNSITIDAFKNRLDKAWKEHPIKFDHKASRNQERLEAF